MGPFAATDVERLQEARCKTIIFKDFVNQPGMGRVWGVWGLLFSFAFVLG